MDAAPWGWRLDEGVVVVALLWWWGVVFDLWIVVASIWHADDVSLFCGGLVWLCV